MTTRLNMLTGAGPAFCARLDLRGYGDADREEPLGTVRGALTRQVEIASVAFIRAGFSGCDIGTSWLLPRIVGAGRAQELMLTGRRFDADEAMRICLLSNVVDPDRLLPVALEQILTSLTADRAEGAALSSRSAHPATGIADGRRVWRWSEDL